MISSELEPIITNEQIEQIEKTIISNGQDNSERTDPIQAVLDCSGLEALKHAASMALVEEAVRNLVLCLSGADEIRRATVREAALNKLHEIGITAPGRLLDAAFQPQQTIQSDAGLMLCVEPEPWPNEVNGGELLDDLVSLIRRYV